MVTKGPIKEIVPLPEAENQFALVPVDDGPEAKKKRRNDLLKMKAKQMTGSVGFDPYSNCSYGKATFVTGGGLPGRSRVMEPDSDEPDEDLED